MNILFTEESRKEFFKLDNSLQILFKKAINKIIEEPERKHLKYGIPAHVIKVNKQARIVYYIDTDKIIILHCFSNHKEYENWYNSYSSL